MPSRDQMTRQMAGDPFGSVSPRSRFAVGDPFLALPAIMSGVQALRAASMARAGLVARGAGAGAGGAIVLRGGPSRPRGPFPLGFPPVASMRRAITTGLRASGPGGRRLASGFAAPAGGRRRTMRVTNVRALRRAMRRVQGFAKLAARTISFTRKVRMKKRRRK